jgi:hypothetical protein
MTQLFPTDKWYKVLIDGKSCHGGHFEWSLPIENEDGSWTPGEWTPRIDVKMCNSGYHLTRHVASWLAVCCQVYECEIADTSEIVDQEDEYYSGLKSVFSQVRLVRLVCDTGKNYGRYNTGRYNTGNRNTGDFNTGNRNTGDFNTGNRNTGDYNTGYHNTGDRNNGDYNTGDRNNGYHNTGDFNTGNRNTGNRNTGYRNTGSFNSGDFNAGHRNTGYHNTGDYNNGDYNTGDYNTGWFNTGDYNTGWFNRTTPARLLFEKPCTKEPVFPNYFSLRLVPNDPDMKKSWFKAFTELCDTRQALETIHLENFSYEIFEEITGITKEMLDRKINGDD